MKNIGIDIRSLMVEKRSGVGEYTYELLNALFEIDKQNQYFLFYNSHSDVSKNIPQWKQDNIHYVGTKWPNKLFNLSIKLFRFPKFDKLIKAPLDYFFSPNLNFTALSKKTKHILTVHDLSFNFYPEFYSWKQRIWHKIINPKKQCELADLILTPSENTKRDIVEYYKISSEKIKVIYPGSNYKIENAQDIRQKYSLSSKFILFLGTVEPRKNIIGLIDAFEKIYSRLFHPLSLVIAGCKGWNDEEIYNRIKKSPLKDKIHVVGYVDPRDKPALYKSAEIFVYPSFYEGFGFPVLEAMACGVPVITSNRSSIPEVVENSAWLVNPNRPSEIAEAILQLTKDEKLRNDFIKKGLEQAKKFDWQQSAKSFLKKISINLAEKTMPL